MKGGVRGRRGRGEINIDDMDIKGMLRTDRYQEEMIDPDSLDSVIQNPEQIRRETERSVPEEPTSEILSRVEKREWRNRIKAMTPAEREVAISVFSDDELFAELRRRVSRSNEYVSEMKDIMSRYYEKEDE